MTDNKTVLDFKDYPDIDLSEFTFWFEEKFIKKHVINYDRNWFNNKYDVDWEFHLDKENRTFSIELKLVDVTDYPEDPRLEKMMEEIIQNMEK